MKYLLDSAGTRSAKWKERCEGRYICILSRLLQWEKNELQNIIGFFHSLVPVCHMW